MIRGDAELRGLGGWRGVGWDTLSQEAAAAVAPSVAVDLVTAEDISVSTPPSGPATSAVLLSYPMLASAGDGEAPLIPTVCSSVDFNFPPDEVGDEKCTFRCVVS